MPQVLPICKIADLGRDSLLTGLVRANVPTVWYGFPAVKAVINVQWDAYGHLLMMSETVEHIMLMVVYAVYALMLYHNNPGRLDRSIPQLVLLTVLVTWALAGMVNEVQQVRPGGRGGAGLSCYDS